MKRTINFYDFCDAFRDADRKDQFSYEGKNALFNWIEEYEDGTGEELELDVIALCCEFYEDSWEDIADNYSIDLSDCEDDEDKEQAVIDYLNDNTIVCGNTSNSIVYGAF